LARANSQNIDNIFVAEYILLSLLSGHSSSNGRNDLSESSFDIAATDMIVGYLPINIMTDCFVSLDSAEIKSDYYADQLVGVIHKVACDLLPFVAPVSIL
jgi:hypothetical protein